MINGRAFDMANEYTIWALTIVRQLKDTSIIDTGRLEHIQKTLEDGRTLYHSDKKYLQEKSILLEKIEDEKRKSDEVLQFLNKSSLQEGRQATENEIRFLEIRNEKLKQEINHQTKIQWTIELIKRLYAEEIGDYKRLEKIMMALKDDASISQNDVDYLKKMHVILQINTHKKIHWTIDLIGKLQGSKIGNYNRLDKIMSILEQGETVDPEEIIYLKEKFSDLLLIKKSKSHVIKNDMIL